MVSTRQQMERLLKAYERSQRGRAEVYRVKVAALTEDHKGEVVTIDGVKLAVVERIYRGAIKLEGAASTTRNDEQP